MSGSDARKEAAQRREAARRARAWDDRLAKPLCVDVSDSIDPYRYEVEEGAEIVGDIVLNTEEEF